MIVLGVDPGPKLCGWALLALGVNRPWWMAGGRCSPFEVVELDEVIGQAELIVVEKPSAMHHGNGANATVVDTIFAGGVVLGMFEACGSWQTMVVSPQQVRGTLIGVGKSGNQDSMLKTQLEWLVQGRPKRWNEHVRDAAAAAIVGHRIYTRKAA